MNYKIVTSAKGYNLIEHVIHQGTLNSGFNTKEELKNVFPDSKLNIDYINVDKAIKVYAIKNIKTNKLVYNKAISNPAHKFFEKLGSAKKALNNYKTSYENRLNKIDYKYKIFLVDNLPDDLRIVTYYLINAFDE